MSVIARKVVTVSAKTVIKNIMTQSDETANEELLLLYKQNTPPCSIHMYICMYSSPDSMPFCVN